MPESELVGDVRLGAHEQPSRNSHDSLVWAAVRAGRQFGRGSRRDVGTDDGKIAIFKFKDVRTAIEARGLLAVGVRIGAESFQEHTQLLL